MNTQTIEAIQKAIRHHTNFPNKKSQVSGYYLETMDRIALGYSGRTPSERLSNVLSEYYKTIGVKNLSEAINYIVKLESKNV